ncbi:Delta(24(24(1)))-sterol reductase [Malassezia cuniculi]|uniref:Delta(24(24(1)))-sterol reductase n=1 Tax=Malassezia cuniculi TaxID=948313 RepID=A0AAF0EPE3_9BASI|nr:Delta(24(24(1)))-sterol reductase [Malassezia cuniculi]
MADPTPFWFQQDVLLFARFMLETPSLLIESLQEDLLAIEEEAEMLRQFNADAQTMQFVELARNDVNGMLERATAEQDNPILQARIELADGPSCTSSLTSSAELEHADERLSRSIPEAKNDARRHAAGQFLFYQAASGENIFLQAGDVKVLLERYGSYENFPNTLHVIVKSVKDVNVDDAFRKRFKYLAHLPESSDVIFATVDWQRTASLLRGIQPVLGQNRKR